MAAAEQLEEETVGLLAGVLAAIEGIPPWSLPQSVLGRLERAILAQRSEYSLFRSAEIGRSARYLANVLIPSLHRPPPDWVPGVLRSVFFHETTIQRHPDPEGRLDSFPTERWFFINGILTDAGMAGWNADYLADLFGRPITIIQNATDGPISDLIECATEKAFGMNGEPVDVAFPEVHHALKDPALERIVIIAHSQGTLIAGVLLRLLGLVYADSANVTPDRDSARELAALRRAGVTLDPDAFSPVTSEELSRLELHCFANCASQMRYVDPVRQLPWIESLGNEHDLVARLGMLAPHVDTDAIRIDGPRWVHRGAWGHLLNIHYLRSIDRAQSVLPTGGRASRRADPFEQVAGEPAAAPRLFASLRGTPVVALPDR